MKQILTLHENTKRNINSTEDLFKNIKKIEIDYTQENFILICLNTRNKILKTEVIFKGGLNKCLICPKTLFRKALLCNSDKIIVAHNHPTGNLNPSEEDREIFKCLKEAGKMINMNVLDNIIFNKKEFYSLIDED